MRVLRDTNVVSYWMGGHPDHVHPLKKAVADFGQGATFFVSAVTTQELMVFARLAGDPEQTFAFLGSRFTTLDFTEACALEGARFAAQAGRPTRAKTGKKGERKEAIGIWQRDAAIAATANHHGLDVLFTANAKDFAPFEAFLSCKLRTM